MEFEVADAARKHGVADVDMLHAIRMQFRAIRQSSDRELIIGADPTGRLLEIVILDATEHEPPCVIHAMELRKTYYMFL